MCGMGLISFLAPTGLLLSSLAMVDVNRERNNHVTLKRLLFFGYFYEVGV